MAPSDMISPTYVVIEVSDTGPGMPPEVRARIFDPFFTTKFTGRGLGLAAVLGIVRSHKGVIQVETALGKGTLFRVLLPSSTQDAAPPLKASRRATKQAGSARILIVDDEHVVRRTTDAVLQHGGFETIVAEGGDEAIAILRKAPAEITLVLLDMMMPGMAGDEVFSKMRAIRPDLPIIISSGYGESQVMRYFAGREVSGFIQKPYTSSSLIGTIQNVLTGGSPVLQSN